MNRLIGITGGMSSGKTTISEDILKQNPDYIYVDVDVFRRSLYKNDSYILELKNVIPELNGYDEINDIKRYCINIYLINWSVLIIKQ